jgi:ferrochelatase
MTQATNSKNIGILLTNLGTPSEPTPKAVRHYLAEFLSDPHVIQIPRLLWWFILHGIVLQTRPAKSARLYQKIWTPVGSPLLVNSQKILQKLQILLKKRLIPAKVVLGMRYGEPSLKKALAELNTANVAKLLIFPLYPQYSNTTTASTVAAIKRELAILKWQPEQLHVIDAYATNSNYISALTNSINAFWQRQSPGQKLLFSFHGIPKRLIDKGDPYYQQCLATATTVVKQLHLTENQWQVVFQSRFGRAGWLQPYCQQVLQSLPQQGYRHIDIICPGFAVDCLETLEEIAITNKELFFAAGGKSLNYIPALNDSDHHIHALANMIIDAAG